MENTEVSGKKFDSLSKVHRVLGIPAPLHPLVSLIKAHSIVKPEMISSNGRLHFFTVSCEAEIQDKNDNDDKAICTGGRLSFRTPDRTFFIPAHNFGESGVTLMFHPTLLSGFKLAHKIEQFEFFSAGEKGGFQVTQVQIDIILSVFELLNQELKGRIDDFSQDVIVSQIELLLNYCYLFYKRKQDPLHSFAENL